MRLKYILLLCVILNSCAGIKPSGVKSKKSLYETFYIGNGQIQYFIKPIEFESSSRNKLLMDITFRHKEKLADTAVINISLYSENIERTADSIIISSSLNRVYLENIKHLFSERSKDMFLSRLSATTNTRAVKNIFSDEDWTIQVFLKNNIYFFFPSKKTKNLISKIDYDVFSLFIEKEVMNSASDRLVD